MTETPVRLSDYAPQGVMYSSLIRALQEGELPHACLITGMEGIGKKTLTNLITQYLLCTGEHKPCGTCPACQQMLSGNHPDVITLQVGVPIAPGVRKDMTVIPINEIREAVRICGTTPYTGSKRVIRIWQAEKMNPAAQNALLKTLEEPPEGTHFLLTCENAHMLLPTIVSRCREMHLNVWPDDVIRKALHAHQIPEEYLNECVLLSGGSPGIALRIGADAAYWARRKEILQSFFGMRSRSEIAAVSLAWKERTGEADLLLRDLEDMIRSLMLANLGQPVSVAAFPPEWQNMAKHANLRAFVALQDVITQAKRYREAHVTWQAVLEQLLLRLMEEKTKWQT